MKGRKKITVVGGGNTGTSTALLLAVKNLGDVVVIDLPQLANVVRGKTLDMAEALPLLNTSATISSTADYADTADSDLVIITAGLARKPGMTRADLLTANAGIVGGIIDDVLKYSPNAIIVMLTNPIEAILYKAYKRSGLPKTRIFGQAGVLDGARFCSFVAEALNVSPQDVTTLILGEHADNMLPLPRLSKVGAIPLESLLPKEKIDAIIARTKTGGAEIVNLLGTGSAHYAPAASLATMAEAILFDRKKTFSVATVLEGEYGYDGVVLDVPVVLGANGIEKVIEIELLPEEKAILDKSAVAVKSFIAESN